MTYSNDYIDDPVVEEDLNEFEEQLQREDEFDNYCNDVENLYERMTDYVSCCENPNLMQHSDYFDLMKLIQTEEYKFTTEEKKVFMSPNYFNQEHSNFNDTSYLYEDEEFDDDKWNNFVVCSLPQRKYVSRRREYS